MAPNASLFDLVVDPKLLDSRFESIRAHDVSRPTRWMLDRVFAHFSDPDGNFVEQFQTTAFDARFFELYLFAFLYYSAFEIDRGHEAPDFVVSDGQTTVAIEATTVNQSKGGVIAQFGKQIGELTREELFDYLRHELPIRFGSALTSKLKKKYWELPHVSGMPFVLAVEAFHDADSLGLGDTALASYLYGITHDAEWNEAGELSIAFNEIQSHVIGPKKIESGFFGLPGAEHVSAVMFTNSGTTAKFSRMAYQAGVGGDTIDMQRRGYCSNLDPDVQDATFFCYDVGDPPVLEWWGQGMVVMHNPNAVHPLPQDFFPGTVQTYLDGKTLHHLIPDWHVFTSTTISFDHGPIKAKLSEVLPSPARRFAIGGISKAEFHRICGFETPDGFEEEGWYCDEPMSLVGTVLRDLSTDQYRYVILGRDEVLELYELEWGTPMPTRYDALQELQIRCAERLAAPQRVYPRD